MWLLTRKSGFDPPSGSHQLPVFLKIILCACEVASATRTMWEYNVRRLRLGTKFSCVVCNEGSKNVWFQLKKLQMIIYAKLQSSCVRHQYGISSVNHRSPSRETPLGPGAKKDSFFAGYLIVKWQVFSRHLHSLCGSLCKQCFRNGRWIHFSVPIYNSSGLIRSLRRRVASWLVRSTPEWAVRVRALAGDIVLCSWCLSPPRCINGYGQT